ncbi:MAG: class I SAM-dependent methyltransferase [Salegentibacter sp.]
MPCSLCSGRTLEFIEFENRKYFQCTNCGAVLLSPACYIPREAEKQRYESHNNDVNDPDYQKFVSPITSRILKDFGPQHQGLDFGCGTGPVITSELGKKNYKVSLYDPYFRPNSSVMENQYNYIICCEVMEHFHEPAKEFERLSSLLVTGGKLYCKTSLFSEEIDFRDWYYKNDPTHVFLYTRESLQWIKDHCGFKSLEISPKLIVFGK